MRQFLYLDTDIVNSIIAQAENGLITSKVKENTQTDTESDELKSQIQGDGKVGGSLAKLAKIEADIGAHLATQNGTSASTASTKIVNQTLHDAAFNIACDKITIHRGEVNNQDLDETGNYLSLTRIYDFIDFDYLEKLFDNDGLIDFLKESEADKIKVAADEVLAKLNREQKRQSASTLNKKTKESVEKNNKKYDSVVKILKIMRNIIPYNRMLLSYDGYLIPLNEKYFRVDPVDLGFKYGGEITCVGMVTNIIGEDTDPDDSQNIFATLQFAINEFLRNILPTKEKNLCIIHPIAVFYGN